MSHNNHTSSTFPHNDENQALAQRLDMENLEKTLYFPKYFEIETVNACNARCIMCTINDWEKGERPIMSDALFEKFAREIQPYANWINTICLNRDGEPTLDKKLPKKIKMLKEAGIKKTTFATHGQQLLPDLTHQLIDAGLDDIMISIDGVTKETFETIRVRLNYDIVLKNTLDLIRIRNERSSKMTIRIRMVLMQENKHEFKQWLDFWKTKIGKQDSLYGKRIHSWGNQFEKNSKTTKENLVTTPCVSPFSTMIIQVDGKVPLCGVDYNVKHFMGDFSKQTIKEIWNETPLMKVRLLHSSAQRNEIKMCQGCTIWDLNTKVFNENVIS